MAKMRRMHAVAQANGQRTIALSDMVVQPDWSHVECKASVKGAPVAVRNNII